MDRYRIDSLIADTTVSDIYKVVHVWLHTPMVLKHLKEPNQGLTHALLEEGRIQVTQYHQNLVAVTDALEIDGRLALVMEWVDGIDLGDWLETNHQIDLKQTLLLFRGIVLGVQAAHHMGVVHRDLKPENVFLRRDADQNWVPKVGDFGLAKRMQKATNAYTLSGTYKLIGTPEYMAPEQIQDPGWVDLRADIFSLGAILYEMVTGEVAFDAEEADDVLELVMSGTYPPVSSHRRGVHPAVERLIRGMLEGKVERRIASCRLVLKQIDAILQPRPGRLR